MDLSEDISKKMCQFVHDPTLRVEMNWWLFIQDNASFVGDCLQMGASPLLPSQRDKAATRAQPEDNEEGEWRWRIGESIFCARLARVLSPARNLDARPTTDLIGVAEMPHFFTLLVREASERRIRDITI